MQLNESLLLQTDWLKIFSARLTHRPSASKKGFEIRKRLTFCCELKQTFKLNFDASFWYRLLTSMSGLGAAVVEAAAFAFVEALVWLR